MRIGILGAGAWGTALAQHAASAGHNPQVRLWARDAKLLGEIQRSKVNTRYLPGVALDASMQMEPDLGALLSWLQVDPLSLLVLATSMAGLRPTLSNIAPHCVRAPVPIVWLCKGVEAGSGLLPHQIADEVLTGLPSVNAPHASSAGAWGPLFGPSFAQEVAAGSPVALTVACATAVLSDRVVAAFHHGAMRVYSTNDVTGVELGGALKNVIAIATGICDGLALGQNARAALITRGLAEIGRLGSAMGARPETFMGLTGLGDLVLTCTGDLSRNRRVGLLLARGQTLEQVLAGLGHVAEGVASVQSAQMLGKRFGIDMPIVEAVAAVLAGQISPPQVVQRLLAREPKREAG
jgi:glycerol-3-phosphate dehydrogenase (NAD(P)+)